MRQQRRNLVTSGVGIDPLTLSGLELYLRSDQVAGSNGAAVASWTDLSSHGRTATQSTAANKPTILVPGSANGQRLIRFDGVDDPNGDVMAATTGAFPATTAGYSFYFYGVFRTTVNSNGGAVLWADDTNGRPQLILDEAGGNRWGWRDNNTRLGGTQPADGLAHLLTWIFTPPDDGSGTCRVYKDSVQDVSATWAFNPALANGYQVGSGPATVAARVDLGAVVWFSVAHNTTQQAGVEAYLRNFFEH